MAVGEWFGDFPRAPETTEQLWLALGFAYMVVITGICLVVQADVVRYRPLLLVLAAGKAGKRTVLPNSRVLIHQPWTQGMQGQATDIEIHARELLKLRDKIDEILAFHPGKTKEQIHDDTDRDKILGAEESVAYGLVDQIMQRRKPTAVPG